MPGVPTSRGCDACRKQRKRCDQAQPSCSRCARLDIECTGAGIRRFIFVDKVGASRATAKKETKRSAPGQLITSSTHFGQAIHPVSPNPHDSLVALLASKLSNKDLRYDLEWAYGPFMVDIPKRLGHSIALDAATRALTLSLPPSPQTRRQPSVGTLHSYTVALEATRLALADPIHSRSTNTLCAVYFLLLCQDRIGSPDDVGVHVSGVGQMLNNPESDFNPEDTFEAKLVVTLCSMMSGEMLLDPKLEAAESSRCWTFYHTFVDQGIGNRPYANLDVFLASELITLVSGLSPLLHTARPPSEALSYYATLSRVARHQRTQLADVRETFAIESPSTDLTSRGDEVRLFLKLLRSYGISLTLGLVVNMILRIYYPNQQDDLVQSSWQLCTEIVSLATEAAQFKPLGAPFMGPFLNTAWAVGDQQSRKALLELLASSGVEFEVERASFLSKKLERAFDVLRSQVVDRDPAGIDELTVPDGVHV